MALSLHSIPSLSPSFRGFNLNHPSMPCFSISPNPPRIPCFSCRPATIFPRAASSGSASLVSTSDSLTSSLEKVEVYDLNGNAVPLFDLWRDRKAVVAFARHFGCVLCRKRADLLASEKETMDAAGVALVLIGPGSVDQARKFVEQTKFKGEVYADPKYSSYNALSFVSGVLSTFTPSVFSDLYVFLNVFKHDSPSIQDSLLSYSVYKLRSSAASQAGLKIIQLYMEGYRQDWDLSFEKETRTKGGWQQGGILVAGPGINNISYLHKDKEAGDDPDIKDIMKACCL